MVSLNNILLWIMSTISFGSCAYVAYCPCMGRFGNQADHFLGALAFSKSLNRTLILPPWVEYRFGETKSLQIPFDTYFNVDEVNKYHSAISMEEFMKNISPSVWPENKRISFCYTKRSGGEENSCNAKSGNPFGPFWDTFDIDFVDSEFYAPLNYDAHNPNMLAKWQDKYPADLWPVLAFTGAPASFPVQKENRHLQKYLVWNDKMLKEAKRFIKKNMPGGAFIGIHLRNGLDWRRACVHVDDSPMLFAAPQCVGYKSEFGTLTKNMCYPEKNEIIRQVQKAIRKVADVKYLFVASDSDHMEDDFAKHLGTEVKVVKYTPSNPHMDLAILGLANRFIGNCVSSYSAFVKRDRDVKGFPSEFWAFPVKKKLKHEEL